MSLAGNLRYIRKKIHSRVYVRSRIPKLIDGFKARRQPDAVFIWIPKNAGTSLHNTLGCPMILDPNEVKWRFCGRGLVTFGHMDYHTLVEKGWIDERFNREAFKFAFARNPYSRTVSLYFYLRGKKFPMEWSFDDFCKRIETGEIERLGLHNSKGLGQCNPQMKWLEHIRIDLLGRFETVAEDLKRIQQKLGLEQTPIPSLNKSTKQDYRELYTERSRKAVVDFYREDFEVLRYSTELELTGVRSIIE